MIRIIYLLLVLLGMAQYSVARAKFQPPIGYILNGAGASDLQNNGGPGINAVSFVPFTNAMPGNAKPVLNGFYTGLNSAMWANGTYLNELQSIWGQTGQFQIPEIDVNMNEYLGGTQGVTGYDDQVAAGTYDTQIHAMAAVMKQIGRPVFLRLGGEMNNSLEGYHIGSFVAAWQRVYNILQSDGVTNVAFVWCVIPDVSYSGWYPGDGYVDWWGIDIYQTIDGSIQSFGNDARSHGKPIMIPECDPPGGITGGQSSWNAWFPGLFSFIYSYNVQALIYVNYDNPQLGVNGADDAINENSTVSTLYGQEMQKSQWIGSASQQQLDVALGLGGGSTGSYGGPTSAIAGSPISLTGSGSTTYGTIASYRFAFLNGPVAPVLANPMSSTTQATFPVPGTYNMEFLVTDTQGYTSITNFAVNVSPVASIGTGPLIVGFHFPNSRAVSANISALGPDGSTANTSCPSSPCTIMLGLAPGSAVIELYYLNAGNQEVADTGPIITPIN